jgi:hypothetical protein
MRHDLQHEYGSMRGAIEAPARTTFRGFVESFHARCVRVTRNSG